MSTHYDDEAQVEELRRWWKENWLPLAAGLALGLVAIFGWEAYGRSRDAHRAEAAQLFDEINKAATANQYDEAVKMTDRLVKDFDNTPYAAAAALKLAQLAVEAGKLDEAQARLQWASGHGSDPALKPLIDLRLARVLWQQGKPEDALKKLDGDAGAYAGLFAELRGDIKLAQGDRAAARAAYGQALEKLDPQQAPSRDSLQQKMDDLADAAVVKS
ncbi:MAG: YfgM family protein [Nevskia sp.]